MPRSGASYRAGLPAERTRVWTPRRRGSALGLWLRGDAGITLAGSVVSAWADQSGRGNNVSQGTGSKQPAVGSINSRPSVRFSAASAQFLSRDGTSGNTGTLVQGAVAQPTTWYAIVKASSATAADFVVFDGQSTRQLSAIKPVAGTVGMFAGSGPVYGGSGNTAASVHLYCWVFSGASSAIYVDNMSTPFASLSPGANAINGLIVGAGASAVLPMDGDLGELVLIAGADTAAQRAVMKTYLQPRWGTP